MKKFNKVLALGMAGSMAISMAACGGSSSSASTGTDGSSTSTAAPTAAPSKDVVTLKWVAVGNEEGFSLKCGAKIIGFSEICNIFAEKF